MSNEVRDELPTPANAALAIEALRKRIAELERKYHRLRDAVNADTDCLPGCSSDGHEDECPATNTAIWLGRQQERIAALERERDEARGWIGRELSKPPKQREYCAGCELRNTPSPSDPTEEPRGE